MFLAALDSKMSISAVPMPNVLKKTWKETKKKGKNSVLTWEQQRKRMQAIKEERKKKREIIEDRKRKKAEYIKMLRDREEQKSKSSKQL